MTLHHRCPKLVVETYPSHVPTVSEGSPRILGRKHNKKNRRLTVHIRLKPAHLIVLPNHLGLQAPDLFLALTDLRGEPGGHALGCNLQVPLPPELLLEVADPLLSVSTLLASQVNPRVDLLYDPKQIISLLS